MENRDDEQRDEMLEDLIYLNRKISDLREKNINKVLDDIDNEEVICKMLDDELGWRMFDDLITLNSKIRLLKTEEHETKDNEENCDEKMVNDNDELEVIRMILDKVEEDIKIVSQELPNLNEKMDQN